VRVHVGRFKETSDSHLKAHEGVEKSCRNLSRRRRRGQRIGKTRSRVGKTRSSGPIRPKSSNEPKNRWIVKHLRACDNWYDREEKFCTLFRQSQLFRDLESRYDYYDPAIYDVPMCAWERRWSQLRDHIVPFGEGVEWCSRIGPTFLYWLEQRFGIIFKNEPRHWGERKAVHALTAWRQRLSSRRPGNRSRRPVVDHAPAQVKVGR
jgi:hypothetical protein